MPKIPTRKFAPYWNTADNSIRLYLGDVREVLANLPEKSVQCVVTSPPYWGLRDYGVEGQLGSEPSPDCGTKGQAQCGRCFVCAMVAVFRGVHRALRDDGVLWLNLGDTYGGYSESRSQETASDRVKGRDGNFARLVGRNSSKGTTTSPGVKSGLKSGNLVGVPWRVALALQEDGWILRQDIIWHKPSPMPESVRNRCTKAHEYIFLFAKRSGYYYDAEAVKETSVDPESLEGRRPRKSRKDHSEEGQQAIKSSFDGERSGFLKGKANDPGSTYPTRNKRSVWTVASESYEGAHFATFPQKLIEPCILAGTSERGACVECGAPWKRIVETTKLTRERPNDYVKRTGEAGTGNSCANTVAGVDARTIGWEPTCGCGIEEAKPCVVLDPFMGSGTTAVVSLANGRSAWGIDLSQTYLDENCIPRIQGALLARPALSHLAGYEAKPVEGVEEL